MPFPWKKNKVARISNFVADLHSPKRGGSLVVETGFPTSLIDLFVKNRSRFKKAKPKKRVHREAPDPPPPMTLPPPPPPPPPPTPEPSNNSSNLMVPCAEPGHSQAPIMRRLVGDDWVAVLDQDITGSDSDPNKVVAAILKTLVVLVVTLSVKKLAFGITISAFVLVFIEYTGKHVVSCLKPCSNANMEFKSFAQRVSGCNFFRNLVSAIKKMKSREVLEVPESVESSSCSSFMQEIEVVETGNRSEETSLAGSELNRFNGEKKSVSSEIEEQRENSQCKAKSKTKRSGKLSSKIVKKLVPKKLRGSNKEKRIREREAESSCSEVPSSTEEDKLARHWIEEEAEQDNGSRLECIEDDEVDYGSTCSNQEVGEGESEAYELERIESIGRGGDSGSGYTMLFLIALAGLVGGRFLALILTITWVFMLKMLKSRGRSVSVHLTKCSKQIYS